MMCPPSSLNKSRIGGLLKFDSPSHTDSEVQVKWWVKLDLSHLLHKKDEPQRMQLYPRAGVGTVHVLHTLWPLGAHIRASAATMPHVPRQTPAQHQRCLSVAMQARLSCSELLLPLHTSLWARGLTLLPACCDTLTKSRPTVRDTHLYQWAWAAHTCQSAVQTRLLCAQPCIYVQAA